MASFVRHALRKLSDVPTRNRNPPNSFSTLSQDRGIRWKWSVCGLAPRNRVRKRELTRVSAALGAATTLIKQLTEDGRS